MSIYLYFRAGFSPDRATPGKASSAAPTANDDRNTRRDNDCSDMTFSPAGCDRPTTTQHSVLTTFLRSLTLPARHHSLLLTQELQQVAQFLPRHHLFQAVRHQRHGRWFHV